MEKHILNKKVLEGWKEIDTTGWRKFARDIIDTFFSTASVQYDSLIAAWGAKDYKKVKLVAHTLKSSCGYVGAERAYEILNAIENEPQESTIVLAHLVESLDAVFVETVVELQKVYKSDYAA